MCEEVFGHQEQEAYLECMSLLLNRGLNMGKKFKLLF
jgi:hypothetical protein